MFLKCRFLGKLFKKVGVVVFDTISSHSTRLPCWYVSYDWCTISWDSVIRTCQNVGHELVNKHRYPRTISWIPNVLLKFTFILFMVGFVFISYMLEFTPHVAQRVAMEGDLLSINIAKWGGFETLFSHMGAHMVVWYRPHARVSLTFEESSNHVRAFQGFKLDRKNINEDKSYPLTLHLSY